MFTQETQSQWPVERSANVLKILGHPVRLKIVGSLMSLQQSNMKNLWESLEMPQSTISNHLATLRHCGIVTGTRKASEMYYHVSCKVTQKIVSFAIDEMNN